jgi:formylglycine-generating enzyme required for sulfatase activity
MESPLTLTLDLELDLGLDLVQVPAGEFWMGADNWSFSEKPRQAVSLAEFWMGRYCVTAAQYARFIKASDYPVRAGQIDSALEKPDYPVVNVSWYDARAFCRWVDAELHKEGVLFEGWQARLPTEAEWEKAGRGTDGREYPWGNQAPVGRLCNFNQFIWRPGGLTPVGHYSPEGDSRYGCADMAGNVWEWTHSLAKPYPYQADDGREGENDKGERVVRGGAFYNSASFMRCSYRANNHPSHDFTSRGFRLCVSPVHF